MNIIYKNIVLKKINKINCLKIVLFLKKSYLQILFDMYNSNEK